MDITKQCYRWEKGKINKICILISSYKLCSNDGLPTKLQCTSMENIVLRDNGNDGSYIQSLQWDANM